MVRVWCLTICHSQYLAKPQACNYQKRQSTKNFIQELQAVPRPDIQISTLFQRPKVDPRSAQSRYCSELSGRRGSRCQAAAGAGSAGRITSATGAHAARGPGSGVYVNVSPVAQMMPSLRTSDTGTWVAQETISTYYQEIRFRIEYQFATAARRTSLRPLADWRVNTARTPTKMARFITTFFISLLSLQASLLLRYLPQSCANRIHVDTVIKPNQPNLQVWGPILPSSIFNLVRL